MGSPASSLLAQFGNNAVAPLVDNANTPDIQALQAQGYQEGAKADVTGQPSSAGSYLTMTPAQMIAQSVGRSQYTRDASGQRDPLQILGDAANSFATGLFTTPVEIANMGVQAVSPNTGAAVSRFIADGQVNADAKKSSELSGRQRAFEARNGFSSEINRQQEQEDVSNGDSVLTASLKRIGRDFLSSIRNSDTAVIGDSIANAAGSIATVGPMEKGLAIAGKAALRGAADAGLDIGAVGAAGPKVPGIVKFSRSTGMPAVMGAQQAAGIDQSTADNILNMSPEELAAHSQSYQDAINAGMSDEEARNLVARNAGLTAGALSFPVAAAAGELRVPWLKAPFNPGSAGEAIANTLKSGADGAIFGVDGTLAENVANKMFVNPNQDLDQGVGDSAAQGAIMGLGMTAATQAPGIAAHAVTGAARGAIDAISSRGQKLTDQQNAAVSQKLADFQNNVMQNINNPDVQQQFQDLQTKASPEMGGYVQRLLDRAQMSPEDRQHPVEAIQNALSQASDKFDAFRRVAGIAGDKSAPDLDRYAAGHYLLGEMETNHDLLESPSSDISSIEDENHPALPHLRELEAAYADAREDPNVVKAIEAAQRAKIVASQVDLSTPEGKAAMYSAIKIAEHTPEKADPEVSRKILESNPDLTPIQKTALENSLHIAEINEARQKIAKENNIQRVSDDIHLESHPSQELGEDRHGRQVQPLSAIDHVKGVMSAMSSGDHDLARQRLDRLGKFAQHMSNKVQALNEHFEVHEGDKSQKRPYRQLGERTGKFQSADKLDKRYHLSLDPKEVGGIKFAHALDIDSKHVHDHYNMLARAYPELGQKELPEARIHPELRDGDVKSVVKKFRERSTENKPQFDPAWDRLTKYGSDVPKKEAPVSEAPPKDEKADTAPASQESANKAGEDDSSTPKASEEEKVPTDPIKSMSDEELKSEYDTLKARGASDLSREERGRFFKLGSEMKRRESQKTAENTSAEEPVEPTKEAPKTRREHLIERREILDAAKPGELVSVQAMPDELAMESEKGSQKFSYRSEDGKTLIKGSYTVDGDTIENLDIGNTHDIQSLGMEARNIQRQISAAHPDVKWVQGYRISGSSIDMTKPAGERGEKMRWYKVLADGNWKKVPGEADPRGADETVPEAETTPASEEIASGSDTEATASEETHGLETLTVGHESQGDTAKSTIAKRYPHLFSNVAKKVVNWFAEGFKSPEKPTSHLAEAGDTPIQTIREAISNQSDAEKFAQTKFGKKLLAPVSNAFRSLLNAHAGAVIAEMDTRLQKYLNKPLSDGTKAKDALMEGRGDKNAVNLIKAYKVFNLLQQNEKGDFEYNNNLLESAVLAGMHWLVTQDQKGRQYNQEELAEMLGIDQSQATDYLSFFNDGHYTSDAVDALRQTIERFWGVKARGDISQGLNRGVSEAMAKEIIVGMKKAGLIKDGPNKVVEETGKQYSRLVLDVPEKVRDGIQSFPDLLERMVSTEAEPISHIGAPPEKVNPWQMGFTKLVKITGKQKRVIEDNQKQPYFLNERRVNAMLTMGKDAFIKLMGYNIHDEMNINDQKSKESYNSTIAAAYDYLSGLKSQLEAAAQTGQKVGDIPVHFEWRVSRVGRFHMQGRQNPQSSKFVRIMLTPNKAELDLSDVAHRTHFQLAAAQQLGAKVENLGVDGSLHWLANKFAAEHPESLQLAKDWAAKNVDKPFVPTDEQMDTLSKEFGEDLTPEVFHALPEYVRFLAHPKDQPFHTDLPLELDGKTDGPAHAMMHLATKYSPEWVSMMEKVGLYIGNKGPKSYFDFRKLGGANENDLYATSANNLAERSRAKLNKQQPEALYNQRVHLFRVLHDVFGSDFNFDENTGQLNIARGITKNPMTTYIYGAGLDGIAGKIGSEVLRKFYESISNGKVNPRVLEALNALTNSVGIDNEGGTPFVKNAETSVVKTTKDFTFTSDQVKNLNSNIKNLFINDMRDSIEDTLAGIDGKDSLRSAVQAQSIVLEAAVRKAWADAIQAKKVADPSWNSSIGLSQDEMDQIRTDQSKKWSAIIEGTSGHIFPAGAGNAELSDGQNSVELSEALGGELRTAVRAEAPGNSGVRALPYSVISQDGNVIQNMFAGLRSAITRALPVHDGVGVSVDRAADDNRLMNEAVLKSWLGGEPMSNASRAYSKFLETVRNEGLPDFTDKQMADLQRALNIEDTSKEGITERLISAGRHLERDAISNRAMKNVLERVNLNVDHMPGTENPHSIDGKINVIGSPEEKAEQLRQLHQEEIEKLTPKEDASVKTLTADQLREMPLKVRAEVMELFHHTLDAFKGNIHIGSRDDLLAMSSDKPEGNADAWYNPNTNNIYITHEGVNDENIVHELVHAATRVKAWQFIHDQSQLSQHEIDAFQRIERLRNQWIKDKTAHGEDLKAYDHLMEVMSRNPSDPSDALNEFMAYATTKSKLIEVGKNSAVKRSRLAYILRRTIKLIQNVVFGDRTISKPEDNLFSNLKFNTHVIVAHSMESHPVVGTMMNVSAHESDEFGRNARLTDLRKSYARILSNIVDRADDKLGKYEAQKYVDEGLEKASRLAVKIKADAFQNMTPQETSTFQTLVATFHTAAKLDPNSLTRIQTMYDHVIKNITVEDFMRDPNGDDPADRIQAQKKLEAISGQVELTKDRQGRSSLLPVFLALANVNDQFRNILSEMTIPKSEQSTHENPVDRHGDNLGTLMMDSLEKATSGEKWSDKNVRDALDSLTTHIGKQAIDDQNFIENFSNRAGGAVNRGNDWMVDNIDRASKWGVDKLDSLKEKTDNKAANVALDIAKGLTSLLSKDKSNELQEGLTELVNRVQPFISFAEVIHEVIGRTLSNASVIDLIKVAKTTVGQLRQKFRENLPKILGDKYETKLTDDQLTDLHKAIVQTDIASLRERYSEEGLMNLLKDPSQAKAEIKLIEKEIRDLQPQNADAILKKTAQLGRWLNTHKVESNFLRNAHAIAGLHDEREERQAVRTKEIVQKIDHLASLYALDGLKPEVAKSLSDIAKEQTSALQYTLDYLVGQRKDELAKANATDFAQMNHFKGFVATENKDGATLRVAPVADEARLARIGYKRVGDYTGSAAEAGPNMAYYHSEGSGKSAFLEGVLQNVRGTAYGVDSRTGFAHGPMTAGRITDIDEVKRIYRGRMLDRSAENPLMPIRDGEGKIVAYERSVDPDKVDLVKKPLNAFKAIGQWRGRQAEEIASHEVNKKLIDALHDMYHGKGRGAVTEPQSYVNIFDPREQKKDPIIADAARLITHEVRAAIEDKFGPNKFMVRRELVNNAIGYRQASVGDMWTGETRWSPEAQEGFRNIMTGLFGPKVYTILKTGEQWTQDTVQDWKTTVVVRSIVVLGSNVRSDFFQLMSRGMNPITIAKGYAKKAVEIHNYDKSRIELNQIEADMRAATNRPDRMKALQTRRQSILDAQKRMSIWPLIESGQYSIISNMGKSENDDWKYLKSPDAFIERLIHKAPEPLQSVARFYTVARDTALFKGLERAVEYSDFLGRAVLYDHLTEKNKMDKVEAMAEVASDFINYDYLPGRSRSYLESIGMTWFWNYKLRAAKVAVSILRHNPLHMLLAGLAPHPSMFGTIGTPMRDNFITAAADGRLLRSIGPQAGLEMAGSLNPWNNMFGIWVPDI